jgi:hypothetical protein
MTREIGVGGAQLKVDIRPVSNQKREHETKT